MIILLEKIGRSIIFGLILSRVQGSLTNNNGFWIGWLNLLTLLLQSLLITINYSAIAKLPTSQITRTCSILVLVLFLNSLTSDELRLTCEWVTNESWVLSLSLILRPTISLPVFLGINPPNWGLWPDFCYCYTVADLLMWSALSDERMGLSFTIAVGPRQGTHSRVRVPWDLRPYFTVSDLRLPFSSPPTTRRATVEVFYPASTRVSCVSLL
jgi:hypothetical protein